MSINHKPAMTENERFLLGIGFCAGVVVGMAIVMTVKWWA